MREINHDKNLKRTEKSLKLPTVGNVQQETKGKQSPAVVSGGDVNIRYAGKDK
jgi:hypothetical protein